MLPSAIPSSSQDLYYNWYYSESLITIVMPRQQRRSAPSRPAVAPKRPAAPTQQQPNRPSSTAAYPPANAQKPGAPAQTGQQPGLFGQMASTAA